MPFYRCQKGLNISCLGCHKSFRLCVTQHKHVLPYNGLEMSPVLLLTYEVHRVWVELFVFMYNFRNKSLPFKVGFATSILERPVMPLCCYLSSCKLSCWRDVFNADDKKDTISSITALFYEKSCFPFLQITTIFIFISLWFF